MVSKLSSRLRQRLRSLDLDKQLEYSTDITELPTELGPQDFEYAIIKLFIIDLSKLAELKATLAKNFHIQPSEIDKMVYWEYELFLRSMNDQVKEENERQKAEMDKYHINEHLDSVRPSNIRKMTDPGRYSPSMPSFGSMKTPNFRF